MTHHIAGTLAGDAEGDRPGPLHQVLHRSPGHDSDQNKRQPRQQVQASVPWYVTALALGHQFE